MMMGDTDLTRKVHRTLQLHGRENRGKDISCMSVYHACVSVYHACVNVHCVCLSVYKGRRGKVDTT